MGDLYLYLLFTFTSKSEVQHNVGELHCGGRLVFITFSKLKSVNEEGEISILHVTRFETKAWTTRFLAEICD